jgi:hypothetical protein
MIGTGVMGEGGYVGPNAASVAGDADPQQILRDVAAQKVQRAVAENLRRIVSEGGGEHVLPDGSRVATALWLDLKRASYIVQVDGPGEPLMGKFRVRGFPGVNHRQVAVRRLRELACGNALLLATLSRVANTNAMAGIHAAMRTPSSPIRLPDGTPGRLLGRGHACFVIRNDGEGGLRVRCDYAIVDAKRFVAVGAEGRRPITLAEGMGAHFSYEVAIASDGTVRMAQPLVFGCDPQPAPTPKPNPNPKRGSLASC